MAGTAMTPLCHATAGRSRCYRVVYNAPAGAYVTLRTTATDAAGGSITEIIIRGYQIASWRGSLTASMPSGRELLRQVA
jgi:hypothetical protein